MEVSERVIRKRTELPGVLFEPGDRIVLTGDAEDRNERWLIDTMAIAGPTGQMRTMHRKCLALAPYQMLHSEACGEPGVWS